MRTIRTLSITLLLALACGLPLGAKNPAEESADSVGGLYVLAHGGLVRLAIDSGGRVEGYYERDGRFGQIYGRLEGLRLEGYWFGDETAPTECSTPRRESKRWGRLSWELSGEDLVGLSGACGAAADAESWTGKRR